MVDGKVKLGTEPTKASLGIMDVAGFVFRDAKASLFFLLVFALAVPAGLGENFGYVRFRELGFSGSEMGISRLLCSISGAIMFWYSGSLSAWLGIEKVMILSFLGYGLRFTLVVIMDHPFHGYLSEIVRGMLFGCFWSAATVYASQIAPKEVRATMVRDSRNQP
jgi:PPP family 3-phenylpropionic acid transporter